MENLHFGAFYSSEVKKISINVLFNQAKRSIRIKRVASSLTIDGWSYYINEKYIGIYLTHRNIQLKKISCNLLANNKVLQL